MNYQKFSRLTSQKFRFRTPPPKEKKSLFFKKREKNDSTSEKKENNGFKMRERRDARTYTMTLQGSRGKSEIMEESEPRDKNTFFCWECVSLVTMKRTVDFVIEKRSELLTFIKAFKHMIFEEDSKRVEALRSMKKPAFFNFQNYPLSIHLFSFIFYRHL